MQEDLLKDETLSISEAAQYIGVHPETLRRWETAGLLTPTFRTSGNQRRYLISDLDNLKSGKNAQDKTDLILDQITTLRNQNEEIRHLVSNSLSSFANAPTFSQPVPSVVERTSHFRPSEIATEHKRGQHAHPAFSAVILSLVLLLVLLASLASFFFVSPSSFKSSLLNPLASFLLSGGARVEGTMRFLSTIFFGEGDQWFISPLGDAHFRNLTASQITASSVTTDYLTVTRSETIAGLNADFLDGKDGGYYLSWNNFTEKPVILSSLEGVSNNEGNIDLVASGNIVITPNDTNNTITFTVPATAQGSGSGLNADLLDSLDSFQFLRSDTSDSFAFGTLTFSSGTTLSVAGSLSLPTGSITSDFILDGTITGSDLAGDISIFTSGNLATTGSGTIASAGLLSAENGFTLSAGSLSLPAASVADSFLTSNVMLLNAAQTSTATKTFSPASSAGVPLIIKGLASQTGDLLQLKDSLDAVLARVDALGNIVSAGTLTGTQLVSTVATGTAPLTVASTTVVPNLNAASAQQPNPNLVLNSDFGRRNKWMTFMPEVFSDTSGWTLEPGSSIGTVGTATGCTGNCVLTAGNTGSWFIKGGFTTWRDIRMSAQFKAVATGAVQYMLQKDAGPDGNAGYDSVWVRWYN